MLTYLILHYKNADITIQCIESLIRNKLQDVQFVVVDNASNNGSYEQLCERYQDNATIHFLHNDENLGYAKGNNVGFLYAKRELNTDWIVLINNDVTIEQEDFEQILFTEYEKEPFYLAGPDIVMLGGGSQNPFRMSCPDKSEIRRRLLHDRVVLALMKVGLQQYLKKVLHYDGSTFQENNVQTIRDFDGVLHGSCLIFSPDYVREFDGLYSGTFLYCEEEIVCYILKKLGVRYSYLKSLKVTHRHSEAMKREIRDEDRRKMRELKERIRSYKKFLHITKLGDDIGALLKK